MTFDLGQDYPNPFNPTTLIRYSILGTGSEGAEARFVRLAVHDLLGREVAVLVNEQQAPGSYEVRFDAGRLASGVYLYRLSAGSIVQINKMVFAK